MNKLYENDYRFIWENFVPARGQSTVLQGELLGQIEKLLHEGCNNGNINWGSDFEFFCDFLSETLSKSNVLSNNMNAKVL